MSVATIPASTVTAFIDRLYPAYCEGDGEADNKALELDRKYVWAYNARGQLHAQRREWKQAVADYSQALVLDPQYVVAYENRARAYDQLGEKQKAQADRVAAKKLEAQKGTEER